MTDTDTPAAIYRVSDLKAAFKEIRKNGVTAMMTEPLPKQAAPLPEQTADPAGPVKRKSCLDDCPSMNKAIAATTALELLKRLGGLDEKFNDNALIQFAGRLSELPSSEGKPSKSFPAYFREGNYRFVPETEATKTNAGAEALITGRLILGL